MGIGEGVGPVAHVHAMMAGDRLRPRHDGVASRQTRLDGQLKCAVRPSPAEAGYGPRRRETDAQPCGGKQARGLFNKEGKRAGRPFYFYNGLPISQWWP